LRSKKSLGKPEKEEVVKRGEERSSSRPTLACCKKKWKGKKPPTPPQHKLQKRQKRSQDRMNFQGRHRFQKMMGRKQLQNQKLRSPGGLGKNKIPSGELEGKEVIHFQGLKGEDVSTPEKKKRLSRRRDQTCRRRIGTDTVIPVGLGVHYEEARGVLQYPVSRSFAI